MNSKYGHALGKWNKVKEEIRQILIGIAKSEKTIAYSELVAEVKTINLEPESYALAAILGEISTAEANNGSGMLSVVVVHKYDDMQSGFGFFELAKELKRDISDREKCWIKELKAVYTYWKSHK